MYDDASVTRLSDEDRWNDRVPPGPRSRLRVLAVMGAVVIGCGVAAFFVTTEGGDDEPTPDPDDAVVIALPTRTSGTAGPDTTPTREITRSPTTVDPGEPETSEATTTTDETTTTTTTTEATTTTTEPEPEPTGEEPPDPSALEEPPPSPTSSSSSQAPTTTTTPPEDDDCWFWIFC
ncbi:hypothetical protein [Prauserella endophytica]|uniref:Serine/threonine protein kinase n=1 Tax=Prauserella endophytica TaxID=1592324 RepID=A0ABY2S8E4_9PSEU|nr:hypothetical protein [Prauserella endophytica]TKG71579.1 hypothetical protein FCN18_12475 [Prauserella endophytica]